MNEALSVCKQAEVIGEFDICVIGGSCTGAFAAVTAAKQGYSVCIIEKQNCFGGVAANGLVHIWHSLSNTTGDKHIIGGLTKEVLNNLKKRTVVTENINDPSNAYVFNTEELKIELDALIVENNITPFLHTSFYSAVAEDGNIQAVIIGNKNGLQAIKARFFIDATGDGDLCRSLGIGHYIEKNLQPPTMCAKIYGTQDPDNLIEKLIKEHGQEYGLRKDWGWRHKIPDVRNVFMHAETHVFDVNCADAFDLTKSEIEGRKHVRTVMDILRKYHPNGADIALLSLPSYIGIRETYHIEAEYRVTSEEILYGKRNDDAILNGSYRIDVHHAGVPGATLKYLDGTQEIIIESGGEHRKGRWREETAENPTFYQIPYHAIVPKSKFGNILYAGRMIDAEKEAYSALRVMVNTNQMGEAAGMAAAISLKHECIAKNIPVKELRLRLTESGSIII